MIKNAIEIILKKDVQQIFDEFSSCFNIRIVFFSVDGEELAVGLNKPCNEYCSLIREKLFQKDMCTHFEKVLLNKALKSKDMTTAQCYSGMIESVIPIFFENIHLGYCMLGQYRSDEKIKQDIIEKWKMEFKSTENLIIAYLKTPSFSKKQIQNIQNFFHVIVNYIVSNNMIILKRNLLLEQIIDHIHKNIDKSISIKDIARYFGKSVSTVSHLFTSILKKSFIQYVIELKLKKAEELFLKDPDITVFEVAYNIGYDDPYYFSRIFKKYKGISPSGFAKQLFQK